TAYITTPQQDRLTVLSVLRNLREPVYRVNDEALSFLQQCGVSEAAIERVSRIQRDVDLGEEQWQRQVEQHVGSLKERHLRYIQEAVAVAAYHAAVGYPVVRLLVVDDGQRPGQPEAERLSGAFDHLFSSVTAYTALDERIAQTHAKKTHLLMVLTHPEIPLHNNPAELGARTRVRKRDVSFGPRSVVGAQCWGTFPKLYGTHKKHS